MFERLLEGRVEIKLKKEWKDVEIINGSCIRMRDEKKINKRRKQWRIKEQGKKGRQKENREEWKECERKNELKKKVNEKVRKWETKYDGNNEEWMNKETAKDEWKNCKK